LKDARRYGDFPNLHYPIAQGIASTFRCFNLHLAEDVVHLTANVAAGLIAQPHESKRIRGRTAEIPDAVLEAAIVEVGRQQSAVHQVTFGKSAPQVRAAVKADVQTLEFLVTQDQDNLLNMKSRRMNADRSI
jgi:hypothetical protein